MFGEKRTVERKQTMDQNAMSQFKKFLAEYSQAPKMKIEQDSSISAQRFYLMEHDV